MGQRYDGESAGASDVEQLAGAVDETVWGGSRRRGPRVLWRDPDPQGLRTDRELQRRFEHERLIDQKTWDHVQSILQQSPRLRASNTRAETPALLKGLLYGPDGAAPVSKIEFAEGRPVSSPSQ